MTAWTLPWAGQGLRTSRALNSPLHLGQRFRSSIVIKDHLSAAGLNLKVRGPHPRIFHLRPMVVAFENLALCLKTRRVY